MYRRGRNDALGQEESYVTYAVSSRAWDHGSPHFEKQLRQIAADGFARMYFRANKGRAHD